MSKILVVDDDVQMRTMISQMLEREGYTISTAGNGKEALTRYRQGHNDLVVLDILMPEMDGIEATMQLKREFPGIRILAMSGGRRALSPQFNLDSAMVLGVQGTLAKPFTREQLLRAVKLALDAAAP